MISRKCHRNVMENYKKAPLLWKITGDNIYFLDILIKIDLYRKNFLWKI